MKSGILVALLAASLVLPGGASAGDKSQSTFTAPSVVTGTQPPPLLGPNSGLFVPGTSKGKSKGDDKCKLQVQLSGLLLPATDGIPDTGDEIICIGNSNIAQAGLAVKTGVVLRGEVKAGKMNIKVDLAAEGIPCVPSKKGGPPTQSYNGGMTCYAPVGIPVPADLFCMSGPALPFLSDPLSGVCLLDYANLGIQPIIATQGLSFLP
jgi:hypothetical protein